MKKSILLLATLAALAPSSPLTTNAATQVFDLNADWSGTQNPNGTWSYRQGNDLLLNNPFSWVGAGYVGCSLSGTEWPPRVPVVQKVSGPVVAYDCMVPVSAGFLENGDVLVVPGNGANILWTAPDSGTIDISGSMWEVDWDNFFCGPLTLWTLSRNGTLLSGGDSGGYCADAGPKTFPHDLSLGSGGAAALQNISVQAGDQLVLAFPYGFPIGLNFTVTLTTDSVDPVGAIEDLALTVVAMNLQNGIENSLDSKLDAALDALVDANFNNDGAACNSLAAFISAVEAQRGKKITTAQADQLIAAAQAIRATLNCGN